VVIWLATKHGTTDASSVVRCYYPSGRYEFLESESDQHNISKKTVKQHTYLVSKFPNRQNNQKKRNSIEKIKETRKKIAFSLN